MKKESKFRLTDRQKKILKIGAIAAGTALAIGGTAYLYKSGKFDSIINAGSQSVNKIFGNGNVVNITQLGKDLKDIDIDKIKEINPSNSKTNCVNCSITYILNSLFGKEFTASDINVDPLSGAVFETGRDIGIINHIFNGVKTINVNGSLKDASKMIKNRSTGIIELRDMDSGFQHVMNYEKSLFGKLSLVDCQAGGVRAADSKDVLNVFRNITILDVHDFSNASLKDNIDLVLGTVVK